MNCNTTHYRANSSSVPGDPTDFGLARAAGPASFAGGSAPGLTALTQSPTVAQPLTAQGSLVGTFQYMAPEQLEGVEADARSDVWALGCVLYEMATGTRAFGGATQASLISSIMKDQPRPIADTQGLSPPAFEQLVRGCLAKDPEERIQSARDVAMHLRWIAEGGSQAGVPAPVSARRRSRERFAWILAAGATLVAVALLVRQTGRAEPTPETLRFSVSVPPDVQTQGSPRISPDGRLLAYNATGSSGASQIWIRPLSALEAQPLPGTEGAQRPFWSPDSRFLAFMAGGKLKKISVGGGPSTVICDAPTGADGSWGTSDVILFDGRSSDPIMRVAASGGVAAPVPLGDPADKLSQFGWPEFLPDGDHFFYLAVAPDTVLHVRSLQSGEDIDLGPCESQVQYVLPGHLLFSRGGSLVLQPFDVRGLKFSGEPVPIAEQVGASGVGGSDFRASNNGVLVYSTFSTESGELSEFDRSGKLKRGLASMPGALMPALSPDERRIAVRVIDPAVRTRDIWLIDRTRDVTTRFTFDKSNENYPLWSPDGKRIAYWTDAPGAEGIATRQLTGSGETELLATSPDETILKDWSRDGSTIFFERGVGATDIWMLPVMGDRKPKVFLNGAFAEFDPRLSPDGRYLAYASDESGRAEVYVQPFPDRSDKWQISTRGGEDPVWGANGKEIYYLSPEQKMMSAPITYSPGFDPGTPEALFDAKVLQPGSGRAHYSVTADGQTFIMFTPVGSRSLPSTTVIVNWMTGLTAR